MIARSPHDPEWNRRYQAVLSSKAWRVRRKALIIAAHFRCAVCNQVTPDFKAFEINHKTYERLGRELDSDLEVVHVECHPAADAARSDRSQTRAANALHDARVLGLARARGYDEGMIDWDEAEDAWERRYGDRA